MNTGREPRLSLNTPHKNGFWQLSPRRLATLLNIITPESASLPALAAALTHDDFYVRSNAAKLLARRADRDARVIMEQVLENGQAPARASAARHLYGFTWFAAEPLFKKAMQDADWRVREGAVYALCQMRTYEAYQFLLAALENEPHDEVRGATAWALRDQHDPLAVKALTVALQASDPEIRARVLETLSTTEMKEAIPVVREALLTDSDTDVIYNAALSYVELAEEACFADFAEILMSIDGQRLQYALRGFFQATNYLHLDLAAHPMAEKLMAAFERAVWHPDAAIRKQAIWPLAWSQHPRASEIVSAVFACEANSEVKAYHLRVVVSLMMPESEALLQDALRSDDVFVHSAAETILEERQALTIDLA